MKTGIELTAAEIDRLNNPRCQYELFVEKYFGIKLTKKSKTYDVSDNQLVDLLCAFHQSLPPLPSPSSSASSEGCDAKNSTNE